MDHLKTKISNILHPKHIQKILEDSNNSIFQSNVAYIYNSKIKLWHYNVPKHDGEKLYKAYKNLLLNNSQSDAQSLIEQLGLTNVNIFKEGSVKEEAIHIPGPGLCWIPVSLKGSTKVLLFNATIDDNNIVVTNWKLVDINESMTSIKSCEALLINHIHITNLPTITFIIGCPLEISINNKITYLG